VRDDHVRHALLASLGDQEEAFLRGHVAGGQHEPMLGDDRDDGLRLGQQCSVSCHADERSILLGVAHLIFGIER
jgi:hypothetical protein